ncbi:hypothetical protein BDR05DRAFT_411141 [Suillus weaverae]|nr:hypothetical protein BDR05DRAFT_411141 [Suillus weaverae]
MTRARLMPVAVIHIRPRRTLRTGSSSHGRAIYEPDKHHGLHLSSQRPHGTQRVNLLLTRRVFFFPTFGIPTMNHLITNSNGHALGMHNWICLQVPKSPSTHINLPQHTQTCRTVVATHVCLPCPSPVNRMYVLSTHPLKDYCPPHHILFFFPPGCTRVVLH